MPAPELSRLIAQVNETAASHPDLIVLFRDEIKRAIASQADPYLVIGLMVEGIAEAIEGRIPKECQREVSRAMGVLMMDRLVARGLLGS
jgi:hypothetical protein